MIRNKNPRITPGSHLIRRSISKRVLIVENEIDVSVITPIAHIAINQPVPARNPPITGYGMKRMRLPSLHLPIMR